MNTKRLVTIAVATMFLIGGVAAVGAASPADAAAENATIADDEHVPDDMTHNDAANVSEDRADASDERTDNADGSDERADNADGSDERADNADGVGPSDGLPGRAADHVSEIHETIDSHLNGSAGGLGDSLSDLLSGDGAVDEADGNADEAEENDDADGQEDAS